MAELKKERKITTQKEIKKGRKKETTTETI